MEFPRVYRTGGKVPYGDFKNRAKVAVGKRWTMQGDDGNFRQGSNVGLSTDQYLRIANILTEKQQKEAAANYGPWILGLIGVGAIAYLLGKSKSKKKALALPY